MIRRALLILTLSAMLPASSFAKDKPDEVSAKAKAAVEKQVVRDWKGEGFRIQPIDEKYVRETFPNHSFVAVHFPLWPVARIPAEPMKSQNLFAVSKEGKVTHLPDSKKLEEFFKAMLKTQLDQDKTTRSWLRLRTEYLQDGFFKFKFPEKAVVTGPGSSLTLVTGVVEVVPEGGNMGSLKATVRFGRADEFTGVTAEENKIRAGIRPRCQATLLLHPELLVREIAEHDLIVMGSMAKEYLMDQRAKARPELRREIDRVWQRIVAEGR